ncbi:hypothetical protein [Sulfitobacter aestuariivivens]|uniref:Uncharacterized protein n=1 Tax=Sulfitobacter aestuariivivens TaxID=2766981 RepID=A0A927D116_9RHOB|nr:hypothetical protein [Sulfitobacter aestuariivivens]
MPQVVENWAEVAHHSALRLRTESAAQGGIPAFDRVAADLAKVGKPTGQAAGAVVPLILCLGDQHLSLFGTIAQFGTPEDVLLDALKIELFFPTDEATRRFLEDAAA